MQQAKLTRNDVLVPTKVWHDQIGAGNLQQGLSNLGRATENLAVFNFALAPADRGALSGLTRPDGRVVKVAFAPNGD